MASKILVVGGVYGQFPAVFSKISALHAKNAFALAIIVGDLFADPVTATSQDKDNVKSLIHGNIDIPLPIYFALSKQGLPEDVIEKLESSAGELCSNLYFLGKRTTIKTSEGIRIVALGGNLDPNITGGASKDKYPPFYGEGDARALRGANTADILVTSEWPAGIRTGSKVEFQSDLGEPPSQQCIADLSSTLKPRYHFSTSTDTFFEREPFFHAPTEESPDTFPITRFISMASFGNPKKQKWIYAFSLDPTAASPVAVPVGATASPLSMAGKKRPAQPSQASSFRFAGSGHGRGNKRRRAPPTAGECFFCLSNPNLATHLITSIGDNAYLTTAKGPLSTGQTFPKLAFPCHILIIPLTHEATLASIEEESRHALYEEMNKYRSAIHSMLISLAGSELGSVTWEVSRSGGVHTHWQFLPISADLIRQGLVEAAFKVEAENQKYPKFEARDVGDGSEESNDFFRVVIWSSPENDDSEGKETSLVLPLDASFRFDLQFGRRVLAKLLGLEQRIDWHDCGQTHEQEEADVAAFKSAFSDYDFTLSDE
ncbi:uncharacterized protein BDZ99DRAFT_489285 [Mytilinidion resinicola]|uniref:CwfJ domain-containing protein n=1 Tax=Mytilinidion resinicola TaxID=574789 RepID=A0A6A6YFP7_9PEZI|nr:uncharacterized protein BDZ99DRAFT_489285 [Mytilinidion resinicola]KAF2807631.1 hypothetical protein BDZ99DRAFT_489285 [Mytilinidion resinicola]